MYLDFILILALMLVVSPVRAEDWYTGALEDEPPPQRLPTVAIDLAFDGSTQGAFSGALVGTIAPFTPLPETGVRLRIGGFGGIYNYEAYDPWIGRVNGQFQQGEILFGYEWVGPLLSVGAYGGLSVSHNGITPNDPNNTVKGTYGGLKVAFDLNATPTPASMLSAILTYSTDHNSYYTRLKYGWMLTPGSPYFGPELIVLGDDFFRQWRFGVHATGIRVGATQFGVSAGYLQDQVRGPGGYGLFEARLTF